MYGSARGRLVFEAEIASAVEPAATAIAEEVSVAITAAATCTAFASAAFNSLPVLLLFQLLLAPCTE